MSIWIAPPNRFGCFETFGQPSFSNPLSLLWNPLDLVSFFRLHSLPAPWRVVKNLHLIWPGLGEYFSCFPDNENDFWRIYKIDWLRDIVTSDSDLIQFFSLWWASLKSFYFDELKFKWLERVAKPISDLSLITKHPHNCSFSEEFHPVFFLTFLLRIVNKYRGCFILNYCNGPNKHLINFNC